MNKLILFAFLSLLLAYTCAGAVPDSFEGAIRQGFDTVAMGFLEGGLADPNGTFQDGEPYLHFAARKNYPRVIKVLLDYGANEWATDSKGRIPLHLAVEHGSVEAIAELFRGRRCEGDLKAAVEATTDNDGLTPLYRAAMRKDTTEIMRYLLKQGANPKASLYGFTPLHMAALAGNSKVIELLLAEGADLYARTDPAEEAPSLLPLDLAQDPDARFLLLEKMPDYEEVY